MVCVCCLFLCSRCNDDISTGNDKTIGLAIGQAWCPKSSWDVYSYNLHGYVWHDMEIGSDLVFVFSMFLARDCSDASKVLILATLLLIWSSNLNGKLFSVPWFVLAIICFAPFDVSKFF
jgi:hypothetical protein